MLGDRRSNSLFAAAPVAARAEAKPEQAEVHDISFEENTGRAIFAETKVAPKASDVFFAPQTEGMPFAEVLSQVQSYLMLRLQLASSLGSVNSYFTPVTVCFAYKIRERSHPWKQRRISVV